MSKQNKVTRRRFLQTSAVVAAGGVLIACSACYCAGCTDRGC